MMKNLKKILIFITFLSLLIYGLNIFVDYGRNTNNSFYNSVKKILPQDLKTFLAKNILIFSYSKKLETEIIEYKTLINSVGRQLKNNKIGYDYIKKNGIEFVKFEKKKLTSIYNKDKFEFTSFRNIFLLDNGKRAYLETYKDNIFIISGNGLLNFININNLKLGNQTILFNKIDTNLEELIGTITVDPTKVGHNNSSDVFGIKGMKVFNENIYISYVKEVSKDCYTVAVLKAKVDLNYLKFNDFFSSNQCVKKNRETGRFYAYVSGGAMDLYKDNKLLLSIGEFGYFKHSQNLESLFGKIIAINQDGTYETVSYGHRNPQGLAYNKIDDVIINTEHGPKGGDEINININPDKLIKNYGWPVSSYGEHYVKKGFKNTLEYHNDKNLFEYAPLHKSHTKYGFIEPIKYYVPSVAPAQIIRLDKRYTNNNLNNYMMATMGGKIADKNMSLHLISFNKEYDQVIDFDILNINDRIRSLVYLKELNQVMFFTENKSLIGFIKKIEDFN